MVPIKQRLSGILQLLAIPALATSQAPQLVLM
mgnify:FL=1